MQTHPSDWEKYLKEFQEINADLSSPSQTQKGFSKVLEQIGTPSKPPFGRGNPKGRKPEESQVKRLSHPVIWKQKKKSKDRNDSSSCLSTEPKNSNATMNQNKLLEKIKTVISGTNFSIREIGEALLATEE